MTCAKKGCKRRIGMVTVAIASVALVGSMGATAQTAIVSDSTFLDANWTLATFFAGVDGLLLYAALAVFALVVVVATRGRLGLPRTDGVKAQPSSLTQPAVGERHEKRPLHALLSSCPAVPPCRCPTVPLSNCPPVYARSVPSGPSKSTTTFLGMIPASAARLSGHRLATLIGHGQGRHHRRRRRHPRRERRPLDLGRRG